MSLNAGITFVVTEQQAACRFQYEPIMFCFATSPQVPFISCSAQTPADLCLFKSYSQLFRCVSLRPCWPSSEPPVRRAARGLVTGTPRRLASMKTLVTREVLLPKWLLGEKNKISIHRVYLVSRLDPADRLQADARDFANRYLSSRKTVWKGFYGAEPTEYKWLRLSFL